MTTEHERYLELLPWYVNGTLSDAEHAEIGEHLKQCLSCHAALKRERQLFELAGERDRPGRERRHGMNALLERIDGRGRAPGSMQAPRALLGYGLAAAVGALVVWGIVSPGGQPADGIADEPFQTLSDEGLTAANAANRIDVIFVETPGDQALEQFLSGFSGTVVGGPTDIGRYTIEVADASGSDIQELLDELRQDPGIRFAGRSFAGAGAGGETP